MTPSAERDELLLDHIQDCIERIHEYTDGERATFDASRMVQDAVLRNLQTLAESTQRLSPALRQTEAHLPWHEIAGFRNVLTHEYLHVDLDAAWSVIELDLPVLEVAIGRMLHRVRMQDDPS